MGYFSLIYSNCWWVPMPSRI